MFPPVDGGDKLIILAQYAATCVYISPLDEP